MRLFSEATDLRVSASDPLMDSSFGGSADNSGRQSPTKESMGDPCSSLALVVADDSGLSGPLHLPSNDV